MGAKTWMLVLADSDAPEALAAEAIGDGDLSYTCPPDDEIHIGCFPGFSVIAAEEFGIDRPSKLPPRFIAAGGSGVVTLHAMHSAVDWFAYAIWKDGVLVRSLSLSPDSGIIEDIGQRLPFEESYWSGEHPVFDSEEEKAAYPFPFHPLDFGEEALKVCFGYQLEGLFDPSLFEPETVPLACYRRFGPA